MNQSAFTLTLTNFRRFAGNHVITFEPGLTIIEGPNGVGKSTLIEAFLTALFGPKQGQTMDYLRSDSVADGPVSVECNLSINNQQIHCLRSNTRTALFINNDEVKNIASHGEMATAQIISLLGGMTRDQFERTYVALQGDTTGFVGDQSSERLQIMEKILQFDVLTKAIKLQEEQYNKAKGGIIPLGMLICNDLASPAEARKLLQRFGNTHPITMQSSPEQAFLRLIDQTIAQQQQKLQEAQQNVADQQIKLSTLQMLLQEHLISLEQINQLYKQQKQLQEKYHEYREKMAIINDALEQNNRNIQFYQDAVQQARQFANAANLHAQLQVEIERYERMLEDKPRIKKIYQAFIQAQTELNNIDARLEALALVERELAAAQEKEQLAKQEMDQLYHHDPTQLLDEEWQRQSNRLEYEEQENKNTLKMLIAEAHEARCPTCHQHFREESPEHCLQRLNAWFSETLPPLQEQLARQKLAIDEKRQQWEQEKQQIAAIYAQKQAATNDIDKKIITRDLLREQREIAAAHFSAQEQGWLELKESVPDVQEQMLLQDEYKKLVEKAKMLRTKADYHAQLPSFCARLTEEQERQKTLFLEKDHLQKQSLKSDVDYESFQSTKNRFSTMQEEELKIRDQLHQAELASINAQAQAQQIDEHRKKAQGYRDHFLSSVQACAREELLHTYMKEFKKAFLEKNILQVMARATELLLSATSDQSILGIKFEKGECQFLNAQCVAHPISRLSGGEQALIGLCLRIALAAQAQTITGTSGSKLLILDEALAWLDEERCEVVKRIFDHLFKNGTFEHILLITHLDTIKYNWHAHRLTIQKSDEKTSTVIPVL